MDAILNAFGGDVTGSAATSTPSQPELPPHARGLRVLLADDNRTNQRLVELLLEQYGDRVTAVSSGRDAVARAAEEPYDLILMDVQMPEMDGFEATAAIREREQKTGVHTPIVAMTAHVMTGDRERCLAAGMDAHLAKPIRPDDLATTIDALLPSGRSIRAAASKGSSDAEEKLLADFGQNGRVLAEVIGVFLVDGPRYLDVIRQARASGDAAAAAAAVHALKGSVGLFSSEAYARSERSSRRSKRAIRLPKFGTARSSRRSRSCARSSRCFARSSSRKCEANYEIVDSRSPQPRRRPDHIPYLGATAGA